MDECEDKYDDLVWTLDTTNVQHDWWDLKHKDKKGEAVMDGAVLAGVSPWVATYRIYRSVTDGDQWLVYYAFDTDTGEEPPDEYIPTSEMCETQLRDMVKAKYMLLRRKE